MEWMTKKIVSRKKQCMLKLGNPLKAALLSEIMEHKVLVGSSNLDGYHIQIYANASPLTHLLYMLSEVCSKSDLWWPVCKVSYITCPSHFHIYEYPSKHLDQHMALQKCSLRCMWKLIWGLELDFEFEKSKNIFLSLHGQFY